MSYPTSLDVLLARMTLLEARVMSLEDHAGAATSAKPAASDRRTALAKSPAPIKRTQGRPRRDG